MTSIAVLMTCFNRKPLTLQCLARLYSQVGLDGVNIEVFLVDDGSSDGTAAAVRERFPTVHLLAGHGNLFWNRGMYYAFAEALKTKYRFYLWLNDDTLLYQSSLAVLLWTYQSTKLAFQESKFVIVGSLKDPRTNGLSYGGYRVSKKWGTFKFGLVQPTGIPRECSTMCGNCVLIPEEVATTVGNIDPVYKHRWGDVDYGFRAKQKHCRIIVAPGYLGECEDNPASEQWRDASLPLRKRLQLVNSIKGLDKQDWFLFTKRHGGPLWLINWLRPYLRIALSSLTKCLSSSKPFSYWYE